MAEETDLNNPDAKVIGVAETEDGPLLMMEEIKNGEETIHQVIGISTEDSP